MKKKLFNKCIAIIMLLAVVFTLSPLQILAYDNSQGVTYASTNDSLRLSVASDAENVILLAVQHLVDMKAALLSNPEALGFSEVELLGMQVGNPFSIYAFDEELEIISNDVLVFPLLYQENVIGIMEVTYDTVSDSYCFTFGQAYASELNALKNKHAYSDESNLVIGRLGDKLFATDGEQATILLDKRVQGSPTVTVEEINDATSIFIKETNRDYIDIMTPVDEALFDAVSISQPISIQPDAAYPNPLPVPHVSQTGVCGVAAWAAVLNYRFGTSYTNATLDKAMRDNGNYSGSSGPNMTDYRDFANSKHNAGTYFAYSISINSTKSAINAGKPIMGSWWSGSSNHAVIICGYQQTTSTLIYYLKNPWYTYRQIITVTGSSVVYPDAGYTWVLSQVVY